MRGLRVGERTVGRRGDSSELCLPTVPTGEYTFGNQPLANRGQSPVMISSVKLLDARDVEVVEGFVVPVGTNLLGAVRGWPPRSEDLPEGFEWEGRTPAVNATVPPGQVRNLVLHLHVTGEGQFDAVRVGYADPSGHFIGDTTTRVRFRTRCF